MSRKQSGQLINLRSDVEPNPLNPSSRQQYGLDVMTDSENNTTLDAFTTHKNSVLSSISAKSFKVEKTMTLGMRKEKRELMREVEQQRK